jgi:ABC-type transporter Mla subunit MlaD
VIWLVMLLAAAFLAYVLWPRLTGVPRDRGLGQRLNALLTVDEQLERIEHTTQVVDSTLAEVRDVIGELSTTLKQMNASLANLDFTMHHVSEASGRVDGVVQRAMPLLNTIEVVTTPMTAASQAARKLRRTGSTGRIAPALVTAEVLPDDDTIYLQVVDASFEDDETMVLGQG